MVQLSGLLANGPTGTSGNSIGTVCFGSQMAVVGDIWDNLTITTSNGSYCDEAAIRVGNVSGGTGGWAYTIFGAANTGPCGTASFAFEDYNLPGGTNVFNTDASGCIHYQIYDTFDDTGLDFTFNSGSITFYGCPLGQVLPIKIKSIHASNSGSSNLISWTTVSEFNNDVQIVERSADGRAEWTEVGRVAGSNSNEETTYELVDKNPLALSYYRLRSLDYDGHEQLSDILVVRAVGKGELLSIHPNPTRNFAEIDLDAISDDNLQISITDITGRILKTNTFSVSEGFNTLQISMEDIPSGLYLLSVNGSGIQQNSKIVKE